MGEESESSLTPSAKLYVTDTADKQDDNQNNALELQGFSQDKSRLYPLTHVSNSSGDSDTSGITFRIGPANLWEK